MRPPLPLPEGRGQRLLRHQGHELPNRAGEDIQVKALVAGRRGVGRNRRLRGGGAGVGGSQGCSGRRAGGLEVVGGDGRGGGGRQGRAVAAHTAAAAAAFGEDGGCLHGPAGAAGGAARVLGLVPGGPVRLRLASLWLRSRFRLGGGGKRGITRWLPTCQSVILVMV